MNQITVVVADDHPVIHAGIADLLVSAKISGSLWPQNSLTPPPLNHFDFGLIQKWKNGERTYLSCPQSKCGVLFGLVGYY